MVKESTLKRQQDKIVALAEVSMRTLSSDVRLNIINDRVYRGRQRLPVYAPHILYNPHIHHVDTYRAIADATALRLRFSNEAVFNELAPGNKEARWIVSILEQYRVESLVPEVLPGLKANLSRLFRTWSHSFLNGKQTDSSITLLFFACLLVCYSRINQSPVDELFEGAVEQFRADFVLIIGKDLYGLQKNRHSQKIFMPYACNIAEFISTKLHHYAAHEEDKVRSGNNKKAEHFMVAIFVDDILESEEVTRAAESSERTILGEVADLYKVFTHQYDREVAAIKLLRPAVLQQHRARLTEAVNQAHINRCIVEQLASTAFLDNHHSSWSYDEEEGIIDGRKLTQVISSPSYRQCFMVQGLSRSANCAVSFLLDTSASMKKFSTNIAVMVDILISVFDRLNIPCELLGFTTRSWNGGSAHKLWRKTDSAENVGRVCDLEHVVYKDFEQSYRSCRYAIATLLEHNLYRESVDGEALEWACQRIRRRSERHKVILVFSDGTPMESCTAKLNGEDYLAHHLSFVLQNCYLNGIEIYGVGLGARMNLLYPRYKNICYDERVSMPDFFTILTMPEFFRKKRR